MRTYKAILLRPDGSTLEARGLTCLDDDEAIERAEAIAYSIAELCRKEGIAQSLYCSWSKEFLEAGKKRLAGDMERQAARADSVQSFCP